MVLLINNVQKNFLDVINKHTTNRYTSPQRYVTYNKEKFFLHISLFLNSTSVVMDASGMDLALFIQENIKAYYTNMTDDQ